MPTLLRLSHRLSLKRHYPAVVALLAILASGLSVANEVPMSPRDYLSLSLEQLMDIEVISPAKKAQSLATVPSAVFVITAEDIKRSGASHLPELLRMAPGMQVARAGPWTWAVNMRDSNEIYSDKLLVMVDGQTTYNHLFAGTTWGDQNLFLEDIDRIEVVRGAGGTMWGANAVNGVINVIHKSAKDTQGGLLVAGGGLEEEGFMRLRYGIKTGKNSALRVYGSVAKLDSGVNAQGQDNQDDWRGERGGFRFDSDLNACDTLMVQAEAHDIQPRATVLETLLQAPYQQLTNEGQTSSGHYLLGRWNRNQGQGKRWQVQAFYNDSRQDVGIIAHHHRIFDLDFQHSARWGERHEWLWGGGYRHIQDHFDNTTTMGLLPASTHYGISNLFVQDEITLVPKQWRLIAGSKFEYHEFSGLAAQPSLRLLWTPNPRHTVWLATSRAVQMLARERFDLEVLQLATLLPDGSPLMLHGTGYDDLKPSTTHSLELGWRTVAAENLTLDNTLFYSKTQDVIGVGQITAPALDPRGFMAITGRYENRIERKQYGFETALTWQTLDWWQWQATFTALGVTSNQHTLLNSPRYRTSLHSHMSLGKNWSFDGWLYSNSRTQIRTDTIPSYNRVDLRLAWQVTPALELSLNVQNLLDKQHVEFYDRDYYPITSEIERAAYAKLSWKF